MTIYELGDVLDENLVIKRYANQGKRHSASFERVETKRNESDSILRSEYGDGETPEEAIQDYVKKIKGKLLVVNASGENTRRQLTAPDSLTV